MKEVLKEDLKQDLKGRTVRGGLAKVCSQATNFVVRMGSLMILARLLEPKDFGLVGMVIAVTGIFSLFKDAGLSMPTVQRAIITVDQISTLFWINMLVGVILALLTLASAPVLVTFYHEPRLLWVTAALAAGFVLNAAGVQHSALLQRQMRFAALGVIGSLSQLVSSAVGIGMAVYGLGYWALVAMSVILPAVQSAGAWLVTAWVPGAPRHDAEIRSMMRFGGTLSLNILIMYIAYNLDKILLGRFWGAQALGIYGRGYQLINLPADNLDSALSGVALPTLSRLQDDPDRLKSYFLKGYSLYLALTIPITIACVLFADDLISIVLGPKWKEVTVIFRLLAPTSVVFAIMNPLGWLLWSTGQAGRSLKIAIFMAPLVIMAYAAGLSYGPNGVALAFSAIMILLVVPVIAWAKRGTSISSRDVLRVVGQPLLSGIVAAMFAFVALSLFGTLVHPLTRLALGCSILFASYLGILLYGMGQKAMYLDVLRQLKTRSFVDVKTASGSESTKG